MSVQEEVAKLTMFVAIGPDGDEAAVSKLVMYAVLVPGDPTGEEPQRQAHVHVQYLRN